MDFSLILRIALVGIIISVTNQILKQADKGELVILTNLAGLILVLFWLLPYIEDLFRTFKQLFNIF